jgi:opacity protein-like surface antigen
MPLSKGLLMRSLTTLTLAGLAAATVSSAALAADLMPPPPPPAYAPVPLDVGSGWYLRGDVDVTGEYRFSKGFKVFDRIDFDAGGGLRGTTHEMTHGDYTSAVFLLNGYVDLGTWYGLTPFVGAGVGVAYNMLSGFSDQSVTDIGGVASPSMGWMSNSSKSNLAWALHAGVGYDVTPNFKVELAYRYLNLGEMRTGQLNCICGAVYSPLKIKDLQSHDIKIGLRWLLNAPPPAPMAMAEGPIVRKY